MSKPYRVARVLMDGSMQSTDYKDRAKAEADYHCSEGWPYIPCRYKGLFHDIGNGQWLKASDWYRGF